jgi:hypothetical protein
VERTSFKGNLFNGYPLTARTMVAVTILSARIVAELGQHPLQGMPRGGV